MEPQKESLKNPQTNLFNKNDRPLLSKSVRPERNLYISPALSGNSEQNNTKVSYQNILPRPFLEQNLVAPNYYLHSELAFGQSFRSEERNFGQNFRPEEKNFGQNFRLEERNFGQNFRPEERNFGQSFRPEVNYERESAESQRLERYNTKADETSDTEAKEHEKENFNAGKEPKVSKKAILLC
jgi:hypothetical protein